MTRYRWILLVAVVFGAIIFSELAEKPALTNADKVHRIADDLACPVCDGQSVAESDVPIAKAIRTEIARMVDEGLTDSAIRADLVSRFGEDIDYTPKRSGLTGLVWVTPILAGILAIFLLASTLKKWQGGKPFKVVTIKNRRLPVLVFVLGVPVAAWILIAQFTGNRGVNDFSTGDIPSSTRTLLIEAQTASDENKILLYNEVLVIQPSNVEALTYRGWTFWRTGNSEAARNDFSAAIEIDPTYPDVRVFRASQFFADGDYEEASENVIALDALEAPPIVWDLLSNSKLRERIASALAAQGELVEALKLLDSGILRDDEDASLLAERGWLLANTFETNLIEAAVESLDAALILEPMHPNALAYRALVRFVLLEDQQGAESDIEKFEELINPPELLVQLLQTQGLLN
ncbi:MAG: Cytochrome c-type biogenesis protein CcmH [Acidimicrobiales bacterium AG-410-I20]|nr:MAG: Cytochrome c-type biogenesis protein CcmH [Acidimicrobiales bacterium AG-410-I20]